MRKTIIFCDGASKGNPGSGGWGALILEGKRVKEIGGGEKYTTNNAMELTAAAKALEIVFSPVIVYTDSRYLIGGATKWVSRWEKEEWKTKSKREVANLSLWKKLAKLSKEKQVEWRHVSGHSGVWGNERTDEIASAFAEGTRRTLFVGNLKDYGADPFKIVVDRAKKERRDKKRSRRDSPAYSYISLVNKVLKIHKTWKECEKRVKGKTNARFKKAVSKKEEKEIVEEFLGNN